MVGQAVVTYRGNQSEDTSIEQSSSIWQNPGVPSASEISEGTVHGLNIDERWDKVPVFASATEEYGYTTYQDTGVLIQGEDTAADQHFGGLSISVMDTDNDEGIIQLTNDPFVISDTAAEEFGLAFEVRVKKSTIADNGCAMFSGLAATAYAVTGGLTDDAGAMKDHSHIGFHVDAAAGEAVDFVYTLAGQADTIKIAGVDTMVADTFVKLGFLYLPQRNGSKRIAVFVNGKEQSTYVTATNIAASGFPDSIEMAPAFGAKANSSTTVDASCSWMRTMMWKLT